MKNVLKNSKYRQLIANEFAGKRKNNKVNFPNSISAIFILFCFSLFLTISLSLSLAISRVRKLFDSTLIIVWEIIWISFKIIFFPLVNFIFRYGMNKIHNANVVVVVVDVDVDDDVVRRSIKSNELLPFVKQTRWTPRRIERTWFFSKMCDDVVVYFFS